MDSHELTTETKLSQIPLNFRLFAKEELKKVIYQYNPFLTLDPDKIYVNIARGATISSETLLEALLKKSIGESSLLSDPLAGLYSHPEKVTIEDQIQELKIKDIENIIDGLSATLVNAYFKKVNNLWQAEDLSIPQELQVHPVSNFLKILKENSFLIERAYRVNTMYPNLKQIVVAYFSKKLKILYNKNIDPNTVSILLFKKQEKNIHPLFLSLDLINFTLSYYSSEWLLSFLSDSNALKVQINQDTQNLQSNKILQANDLLAIKSTYQTKLEHFWQNNFNNYRILAKFSYLRALFEQQESTLALSNKGFKLACQAIGFDHEEIRAFIELKEISLKKIPSDILETPLIPNYVEISSFTFNNQTSSDILQIRDLETNELLLYIPGYTPSFIQAKNEHLLIHWIFHEVGSPSNLVKIASHFPHSSRMINKTKLDAFLYQDYVQSEENIVPIAVQRDIFSFIAERQKERTFADLSVDGRLIPFYSPYFASIPNYQSTDSALFATIAGAIEYIPFLLPNIHDVSSDLHELFPNPHTTAAALIKKGIKEKLNLDIDPDKTFIRFSLHEVKSIYDPTLSSVFRGQRARTTTQSLTEATLNNYRANYSPFGYTTIIYQDLSGKAEYTSSDQLLHISDKEVEEMIQKADLQMLHTNKLHSFWNAHADRVKYFCQHRYLQQALEEYQSKTLSEEGFKMVTEVAFYSLALEQGELPEFINPHIRVEIVSIADYLSTDMFLFRDTNKEQVVLYIAGNNPAFFCFASYEECLCFFEEKAKKEVKWRKLLSSHFSMDVQEVVLDRLKKGSFIQSFTLGTTPYPIPVSCSAKHAQHPITTKSTEKGLFEVIQKNIQERSYLDANVMITSDRELMLKNMTHLIKSIEMLLLIPSLAFPILNWVSLAALATETALNLYITKNGNTLKERRQAALDAGISSLEFLLIGAFVNFRSLQFSKNQSLSEIARQDQIRGLDSISSGSGVFSLSRKAPVSEEVFFGTTESMQVWQIATPDSPFSHFDAKAWFLDEQFLLFTGKTNKAKHLIISSHGGYFPGSNIVKVPEKTELVVLGPHGWQILDPETSRLAKGIVLPYGVINKSRALPTQTAFYPSLFSRSSNIHIHPKPTNIKILAGTNVPGHIKNYSLTKYQKFGAAQENYLDIIQIINHSRHPSLNIYEMGFKPVDVLTIRNRGGMLPPNLKDVFTSLKNHGIHYDKITLEFCRSNIFLSTIKRAPTYIPASL